MTDWIEISPDLMRQVIDYDPETGSMVWKERDSSLFRDGSHSKESLAKGWNKAHAGKSAISGAGAYYGTSVLGRKLLAHRIAWAIHYGEWPKGTIDHINRDGRDNRICNLRDVSPALNTRNRPLSPRNTSGVSGVRWDAKAKSWVVTVGGSAKNKYVGSFKDFDEAVAARKNAEIGLGYHPNHGREVGEAA